MYRTLNEQIDALQKIVSRYKNSKPDIDKLLELQNALELLSNKLKAAKLEGFKHASAHDQNSVQDAMIFIDRDYQVVRFAGSVKNVFRDWKNASVRSFQEIFSNEDFENFREQTEELLAGNQSRFFESQVISYDQIKLPVQILLEKTSLNGRELISASLKFFDEKPRDISDYKDILIENLPGLDVYLFDNEFRHVISGGKGKELLNLTNASIKGKTLFEIYDQKTQKRLYPFYKNALDGSATEGEVKIKKDIFFISASPVFDIDKNIVGGTLILQNITNEKKVEENLIKAKREAEEADKAKSLFLANMSHEIRTPLNAIIGFTKLLDKTKLTSKQKKYSYLINQSSEHLLSVVNEILFIFKLGMGKIFIEKIPFNLHELTQNVHDSLNFRAAEKNLNFQYKIDKKVPEILIGDPFRIKQIIFNITTNAIKFTDQGFVTIKLSVFNKKKKKVFIRFEIEDTGIGISKKNTEKIFHEFTQLGFQNQKTRKGAGLGLTITQKLVQLLKGQLHVESELGKGSVFTVILPFQIPRVKKLPKENRYEIKYNLLKGKKVLFADDDENNVLLAEAILNSWNTNFIIAYNGREALELLLKEKFDIALVDIHMPELYGDKVVKKIRKDKNNPNNRTKMLAVTANVLESDLKKYLQSGFDDFILKPFNETDLYNKICSLLEIKSKPALVPPEKIKTKPEKNDLVDTTMLLKTAKGDLTFYNKMIDTFIENTEKSLDEINRNKEKEDWKGIGEEAHKLQSSFRYFKLMHCTGKLAEVENLALRTKQYEKLPALVNLLNKDIKNVLEEMQNIRIPDADV